jgi:hypothetical protein
MLLKAGTYRFNNVLDRPTYNNGYPNAEITYTNEGDTYYGFAFSGFVGEGEKATKFSYIAYDGNAIFVDVYIPTTIEGVLDFVWADNKYQTHTITQDTEVGDTFGTWYIANTNYNEVNTPTVDTIYTEKSSWYKSVANAIRSKKGTTAPILRDDFASEIASITGGGGAPYFDGTVIIEKAESVLGLRRFKESVTPYTTLSTQEEILSFYATNYFTISPDYDGYNRLSIAFLGDGQVWICVGVGDEMSTLNTLSTYLEFNPNGINILSTANSTVDEWLLANTEGVSV